MTSRLDPLPIEEMAPEQRAFYDRFNSGLRVQAGNGFSLIDERGQLLGPPDIWIRSPRLGTALEQLGHAVRFELTLSPRAKEIVILMVAHDSASPFEIFAHTQAGLAFGLDHADLAALSEGKPPAFASAEERAVHRVTASLLRSGTLDIDKYRAALGDLSVELLFEVVLLVGYYRMIALQLSVFDVLPPGADDDDV